MNGRVRTRAETWTGEIMRFSRENRGRMLPRPEGGIGRVLREKTGASRPPFRIVSLACENERFVRWASTRREIRAKFRRRSGPPRGSSRLTNASTLVRCQDTRVSCMRTNGDRAGNAYDKRAIGKRDHPEAAESLTNNMGASLLTNLSQRR